ncbi:hypothetical protein [Streptomyces sp. MMS24-I29]|uniref:hypothetical protein n=1 Tax=Streptomyces sp. MMS24-I29 TaxID=3351480 RepID=UPI003C7E103F
MKTDDIVGKGKYAKVGYFVQWGIYGRQYFVKNLHDSGAADRLDIINYSFAKIDPTNLTCLNGVTKGTTADPQDPTRAPEPVTPTPTTAARSAPPSPSTVSRTTDGPNCGATSTS